MVLPIRSLGPGKFYGNSLPRPRFYTDIKYNDFRVDPPVSVSDPLLNWANEAHWSMGGLSRTRLRLQGKIEGNVEKLRKEQEKKDSIRTPDSKSKNSNLKLKVESEPDAPRGRKVGVRSKVVEKAVVADGRRKRRRLVRKLGEEFEFVAGDEKVVVDAVVVGGRRLRSGGSRRKMVLMNEDESEEEEEEEDEDEEEEDSKKASRSSLRLKKKRKIN